MRFGIEVRSVHIGLIVLPFLIFVCWGFIGYCVVNELGRHYNGTRRWLLAPITGLCLLTLLAVLLNRFGLPVRSFGLPLTGVLLVASLVYWITRRPHIDWRKSAIWAIGFFVALLLVAWPLIVAGTNWLSTGNGDMTAYVLGATHFYDHGFYQIPSLQELMSEVDPTWDASFVYSLGEVRFASQLIIAWFMSVSSLTATQSYMIVTSAVHLVVLSSTAALVCSKATRERIAFATLVVVASSANFVLGSIIQLIPQDFGLALLAAAAVPLLDRPADGSTLYRQAGLGSVFVGTMLVAYPEALPFLVLSVLLYVGIGLVKREIRPQRWLLFVGVTAVFTVIFANANIVGALHYLIGVLVYSSSAKVNGGINALFPYYLTPLGLSLGWGFTPIGTEVDNWRDHAYMIVGGLLYAISLIVVARAAWRLESIGVVALTMLGLFLALFAENDGFGLFKLAMYVQPFVLGTLTVVVAKALRGPSATMAAANL